MEFILTVKKQASLGDASAQFTLGWSYEHGTSVPQNYELAFEWYMKAALQNHANSMYFVAHAYRTGVGAVMNEAAALEWYHKAADAGSSKARLVLQSWPDRGFELPAQTTDNALISEATRTLHRQQ